VESRSVFEQPRSVADFRCGAAVVCASESARREVHERRALHRGRHVDSSLASQKSFRSKDGSEDNGGGDFHGQKRNGLIAAAMVSHADAYVERDAALLMLKEKQERHERRITTVSTAGMGTCSIVCLLK